jgi:hypothetical protein
MFSGAFLWRALGTGAIDCREPRERKRWLEAQDALDQ